MKVSEAMTRHVETASPDQPVREAARRMGALDAGAVPVGEGDRLVGMLTDRDLALRVVAENKGPDTPVREAMTRDLKYCFADDDTETVGRNMAEQQIRRLPVLDRDKRLVGILAIGDIAFQAGGAAASAALAGVSQPGGPHSQTGGPRS
ncbi:CBS domain-containing protein [Aquibium sp. A9E412]|uniref:CBS domain-containing protein n=1 Tax=Aquibium sp. A9E412 TaxID=2976767 RepID=UPI0025B1260F|nr:CBS domain-containing protein [Aquibium sp. A9E412]MDN2568149.1 CBS domain-containing protein [Aquibium sp. A9E412]